jgi:hypothetical protein
MFHDMPAVDIFMDDTIIFGYADFDAHLIDVAEVLKCLLDAGMQVNPDKCYWFQVAVTYLGFYITREGIKPQQEKIQGILNMKHAKGRSPICRNGKFLPRFLSQTCQNPCTSHRFMWT